MKLRRPVWAIAIAASVAACTAVQSPSPSATAAPSATLPPEDSATPAPTAEPETALAGAWVDATAETIGETAEWTNKVELADVNADGLVDLLFANGGDYDVPGEPVPPRVFLNGGPGQPFTDATASVFGELVALTRVIKVRDVNGDGWVDIFVGTTFQTQSQLLFGAADGSYTNVTDASLPATPLSVGDAEFGDVDADGDLDLALADWGAGSPMTNTGAAARLWLNDGAGAFMDATEARMPQTSIGFSWDLELMDIDNDWDLDLAISSKTSPTSFLFDNNGTGTFSDVTDARLPHFTNNYEFEPIDLNGDGALDLLTINDGDNPTGTGGEEHAFINDGAGTFTDATEELWPPAHNLGHDDNVIVVLDIESDGDADFIIGSLSGPDRLLINIGDGRLQLEEAAFDADPSGGTLGMALADLNGDGRLDVVEGQGEVPGHEDERVYLATDVVAIDSAAPHIVTDLAGSEASATITVHARVHDNKSPNMPHDWQSVVLRMTSGGAPSEEPMTWYGEHLWRITVDLPADATGIEVCATDATGNEACG